MVTIIDTSMSRFTQVDKGNWRASGNTIYMTNLRYQYSNDGGNTFTSWMPKSKPSTSMKIRMDKDERGQHFIDLEFNTIKFYKS